MTSSKKLVIQIPCYNEESSILRVLESLPQQLPEIDSIEILIVHDGSSDNTVSIAQKFGVKHILKLQSNRGLARAFQLGIEECLKLGADYIINIDGDNQYQSSFIGKLLNPILLHQADVVVGSRPIEDIEDFSWIKQKLQRIGTWVVNFLSGLKIQDATSGFRAFSRFAACQISIVSDYTYTLETLVAFGQNKIRVMDILIQTNKVSRPTRLVKSNFNYVCKSVITLLRIYWVYAPLKFFFGLGSLNVFLGLVFTSKYFYYFLLPTRKIHLQSMLEAVACFTFAILFFVVGIINDTTRVNRKILEKILSDQRIKKF